MLTHHPYKPFPVNINDPEDTNNKVYDCCRGEDPNDPKCTDCCYDKWTDKLKIVIADYNREEENAIQAKKKFDFASEKSQRYRTWLDELDKAEELARLICHQLDVIANQSERIWYNSVQAEKAIEILFCMIRDFYMQVDCIRKRYDVLWNCITSNNDPAVQARDKGIIKCLTEYLKRLEDVIKTRNDIIKAIVDAVRISKVIRYSLSTKEFKEPYNPCEDADGCDCCSKDVYYGFKAIICEWYCDFRCDVDCKATPKTEEHAETTSTTETQLCSTKCKLTPKFKFPFCNNNYKTELTNCLDTAKKEADKAGQDLLKANKNKEALTACKEGLKKAIAEADPKVRCN